MYINVNTEKIGYEKNFWFNSFSFEAKYYKSTLANILKEILKEILTPTVILNCYLHKNLHGLVLKENREGGGIGQ